MTAAPPLVEAIDLTKRYRVGAGTFGRAGEVLALDGVSLALDPGVTFAVVGESGCGKSTLARCIGGLVPPSGGEVRFGGLPLSAMDRGAWRRFRRDVQMVFQDPYGSLNPRRRIGDSIAAPLAVHGVRRARERRRRVDEMLERVGLTPPDAERLPTELSGGQQQRVGIARALVLEPKLLVADEPVSALDVSVQAQILNLLADLQRELGLCLLFIGHDLGVIRQVADVVAVMYLGRIVERAPAAELFAHPRHPYTDALISSAPIPDPATNARRERHLAEGELPSPLDPPSGCAFHPRCRHADELCRQVVPELTGWRASQVAACHHPLQSERATAALPGRGSSR